MSAPIGKAGRDLAQHRQPHRAVIGVRKCQFPLRRWRHLADADPARTPGHALDRAGGFQRFEMVLRRAHALETERAGDFRLRGRHAFGLDPFGDQGEDGVLGFGQFHG